jgi:deoxyribodipyrimidine photolyase
MNPLRQARRFDPSGDYVRRYVPELASVTKGHIHTPWQLPAARRRQLRYPARSLKIHSSERTACHPPAYRVNRDHAAPPRRSSRRA